MPQSSCPTKLELEPQWPVQNQQVWRICFNQVASESLMTTPIVIGPMLPWSNHQRWDLLNPLKSHTTCAYISNLVEVVLNRMPEKSLVTESHMKAQNNCSINLHLSFKKILKFLSRQITLRMIIKAPCQSTFLVTVVLRTHKGNSFMSATSGDKKHWLAEMLKKLSHKSSIPNRGSTRPTLTSLFYLQTLIPIYYGISHTSLIPSRENHGGFS